MKPVTLPRKMNIYSGKYFLLFIFLLFFSIHIIIDVITNIMNIYTILTAGPYEYITYPFSTLNCSGNIIVIKLNRIYMLINILFSFLLGLLSLISVTSNTYTVKSGDSLYSIAKKYNTTVDRLKSKNNLTSNLLSIGQVLNV